MRHHRTTHVDSAQEALLTLGRLVDQALERIRIQRARVELAEALQRHLLPPQLPQLPRIAIAARYTPSRDGLDVGGDWYDAFPMTNGSVGVTIGDVQGHDVEAIAFMGQARTSLRALAGAKTDPGEILSGTNDLLISMSCGLFATCCFLTFDPVTGALAMSRAGHIPMVWATDTDTDTTTGSSGIVLDRGGPPLGILPGETYPVTRRRLTEPGSLVLVTDGVVEGPSCPLEKGLDEVVQLVRGGYDGDPDRLAGEVIKVADLTGHRDDAAVLVVRYAGIPSAG
ncbi:MULTISPECIES: PP2C family protein-serine/threonine phosphatase [unclassified Streptomyces]|uniref:PP2C family protein-serine/threonine phosphatase n=1 Tax=unclassified Streptomyces TaxID=2593676 RepID=UPI0029AE905C|nr:MULTISPECIES: PP2C family protein-serine/threonine phosphatase [unclassified Streptomyces]MDX3770779.1 PP2C family protein-serine/threonine phosphatase [Streptomyces sp. AK08-01B]MDX3818498.1 PP2C family protein-serine/threonine phosphatase [Streptomyces sp. AK08-01A]